jgi:alkylhydroperoxidase/carboxymuconolactone decarboxylase family protein YurZ
MTPDRTIDSMLDDLKKVTAPQVIQVFHALHLKTRSLVGISAAVALGASTSIYRTLVDQANSDGATVEECLGAVLAVALVAGLARVMTAAPRIASAIGYDIDQALE